MDAIIRVKCLCNTRNEAKSTKSNVRTKRSTALHTNELGLKRLFDLSQHRTSVTATVKKKKEACICALSATDTEKLVVTGQNDGQDSHDQDLDMHLTGVSTSLLEDLKSYQESDPILSKVKQWLLAGSRPEKNRHLECLET